MLEHVPGIAGVDEAGRGPLAGPVVAAAVILPPFFDTSGLDDSKKLSKIKRELLAERIQSEADWALGMCDHEEIDRENILNATMMAMARAIGQLSSPPEEVWVDGDRIPQVLACPAKAIIKGDGRIAAIAAASILAKTQRDRLMKQYADIYPAYGFDKHFGYPTPDHIAALRRYGPCPIHRRSFGPVASLIGCKSQVQPCLTLQS